ncbi:MAG: hypothetical protein IT374_20070 [Polyangiaceae bacterium]|nr:hypothetical protein [Polyangiaceae bacterium]
MGRAIGWTLNLTRDTSSPASLDRATRAVSISASSCAHDELLTATSSTPRSTRSGRVRRAMSTPTSRRHPCSSSGVVDGAPESTGSTR